MKKTRAYKHFNTQYAVEDYSEMYKKLRFDLRYPPNIKRLEIFANLLKKHKPKKIIDAGCGAGMPLIFLKKMGFNITGYDKAKNMVLKAKENLENNNISPNLIFYDDFENPRNVKNNSVDCILGMGAFYYSKNFKKTILNQKKKLKKKGRLIFSARNRLFDISTLNNYTQIFLNELHETKYLKNEWKKKYKNLTKNFSDRKKYKFRNIDEQGVVNHKPHNPLTIDDEMKNLGFKVEGKYFYHYHPLPPVFENFDKVYFRKISWKMENPNDWRGYLLASAMVIDCKKI